MAIDRFGEKWFYRCVASARVKLTVTPGNSNSLKGADVVQKEENVTPVISVEGPVVNGGLKGLLGMFKQFVTVGGDFV